MTNPVTERESLWGLPDRAVGVGRPYNWCDNFHPGSRRPRPLAVEECAILWPGCRPTWALERGPRALPVGLHINKRGLSEMGRGGRFGKYGEVKRFERLRQKRRLLPSPKNVSKLPERKPFKK